MWKRPWGSGKKFGPARSKKLGRQRNQQRRSLAHRLGEWMDEAKGFANMDADKLFSFYLDYDAFLYNRKWVTENSSPHSTEDSPVLPRDFVR